MTTSGTPHVPERGDAVLGPLGGVTVTVLDQVPPDGHDRESASTENVVWKIVHPGKTQVFGDVITEALAVVANAAGIMERPPKRTKAEIIARRVLRTGLS